MELSTIPEELHSKIRIGILSALFDGQKDFKTLKEITNATDGNLSVHIKKLQQANYIKTEKFFENNMPKTVCSLTDFGKKNYIAYLKLLLENVDKDLLS